MNYVRVDSFPLLKRNSGRLDLIATATTCSEGTASGFIILSQLRKHAHPIHRRDAEFAEKSQS